MLAPYQKYSCTNSNKQFVSHPYGIHNEYQEMRSYQNLSIALYSKNLYGCTEGCSAEIVLKLNMIIRLLKKFN